MTENKRHLSKRIILDLCGGTGSWSKPYKDEGYDVRLITLPEWDVVNYAKTFDHDSIGVHGIFAAPPCDCFSVSGAQYWKTKDADGRTAKALEIVDSCLEIIYRHKPVWWALENPVGRLKRLRKPSLGEPDLIYNPCEYGGYLAPDEKSFDHHLMPPQDAYSKKTLLWGVFKIPPKRVVEPIIVRDSVRNRAYSTIHMGTGGKSEKTKELRSRTPQGFAKAFFTVNP